MSLTKYGSHTLESNAAKALERATAARGKRIGFNGTLAAYRTRAQQQHLYNLYKSGKGNLAAPPGMSKHEVGLAIDIDKSSREWLAKRPEFGWVRTVASEPWHFEYQASRDQYRNVLILKRGSRGPEVGRLQSRLNAVNGAGLAVDNSFGPKTLAAVKAFQKKKGLKQDGVVGPLTRSALGM